MAIEYTDSYQDADFITHGGNFHADDIFCIALFEYLYDSIKVYRLKLEDEGLAKSLSHQTWFDIGGGSLDHHQKGGNGYHEILSPGSKPIPFASFGLVWNKYGEMVCKKFFKKYELEFYYKNLINCAVDLIDRFLVRGIDASDNGIFPMKPDIAFKDVKKVMDIRAVTISCIISVLNPDEDEADDKENIGLHKAILFARQTLLTYLRKVENSYIHSGNDKAKFLSPPVDSDYKRIVFEECRELLGVENHKVEDNYSSDLFSQNELFNYWNDIKDYFLEEAFGNEWQLAEKNVTSLMNGLCAEMDGINSFPKSSYDDVYFGSLKDIYGTRLNYYGENYEEDLKSTIRSLFNKVISEATIKIQSAKIIKNAVLSQKGRILELPERTYWKEIVLVMPEAQKFWFVILPTQTGLWKVCPIKSKRTKNGYRKGFPTTWRGLRREQLESQKNIYGVHFIHNSGIMALCDNKKSAIKLCKRAFGNTENNIKNDCH